VIFNFLLFSCDRNKQEETVCSAANTVLIPQDLKDRFFFKEGTYWIYQNIQTNETDSVWVWKFYNENVSADKYENNGINNKCYETIGTSLKSIMFVNKSRYTSYQTTFYPKKSTGEEVFGLDESTPLNNYTAIYRIEIRGNKYENQDGAEILMLDSLTTGTKIVFKDILRLKYPVGFQTQDYMDDMHYAKNIGLVKFHRFTDNSNWELIRYNIIQ
jgi:hypothetical protein